MHYEHFSQPLLDRKHWLGRVTKSFAAALLFAAFSLSVGIMGYHYMGGLAWVDSLLEASMILGGMGPVATMQNDTIKVFASIYALYSGLFMIGATGLILAPWLHRMLHIFHLPKED
ncbi:MAG: hypothetical protein JO126_04135 [Alphaproteobacteria bacterium]|nr:hypothetical protein [Alphaproteobacteria bacterium]MBV8548628.1 hypothetical protein [Alphaproteobacteria bacterium]